MKKHYSPGILPAMAFILLLLPGCKKSTDYLKDNPAAEFCPCRIRQINLVQSDDQQKDTLRFSYNASGDPVSIVGLHGSTGHPNWLLRYDPHGRLTDLIGAYRIDDLGSVERWNRYFYDAQGRIVKDSLYDFPGVVDGRPVIDPKYFTGVDIILYEYDDKGRVSKETFIAGNFTLVTSYAYDAHGNRMEPTLTQTSGTHTSAAVRTYDNKINYHRTSKVWMFIDKDYSVDNPLVADYTYNAFGLPVSIVPFAGTTQNFFTVAHTTYQFDSATIGYDCQGGL
ncbi:hypothetical protein Q4E93_21345 [Flavitalea sp. BT771]|uniref:hypothetical protein n=1 Tax=Flavitalea sp. BT771 TaxID=3063329 RepID=UPI0026E39AE3|nr:hypothetical protein [Flavitalea sp. BT771]MDO6433169.1 hypothetical protein [Flavitalea sp. BT771]MDV6221555.1 hypothetical protein [Flavitalea sp. BT771]